jgi:hypothetical protein
MRSWSLPRSTRSKWHQLIDSSRSIGFVNFKNGDGGDYHLLPTSPAKGAASDGTDLGADVDAVLAAVRSVR